MVFSKAKGLIYLHRNGFELHTTEVSSGRRFEFPKGAVENLEVLNPQELSNSIKWFVDNQDLKPLDLLIVLSEDTLFYKILDQADVGNIEEKTLGFIEDIPFEPNKIIHKSVNVEGKIYLLATNKEFYETIIQEFSSLSWKIQAVVPIITFGAIFTDLFRASKSNVITPHEVSHFLEQSDLIAKSNLLANVDSSQSSLVKEVTVTIPQKTRPSKVKKFLLSLIALLTFITSISVAGFLIAKALRPDIPEYISPNSSAVPTEIPKKIEPEPTEIASSPALVVIGEEKPKDQITKKEVRVQVLNGTGVPGQATEIADKLSKIGYNSPKTANASNFRNSKTKMAFSPKVSRELIEEIVTELKKTSKEIIEEPNLDSQEFDIVVTTGKT